MKHTPGPWTIPCWRQFGRIDVCANNDPKKIVASVHLQSDPVVVKGWPTEEGNARLIAAAPDLFAALQRIVNSDYDNANDPRAAAKIAAAAIAKAEAVG